MSKRSFPPWRRRVSWRSIILLSPLHGRIHLSKPIEDHALIIRMDANSAFTHGHLYFPTPFSDTRGILRSTYPRAIFLATAAPREIIFSDGKQQGTAA